MSLRVHVGALLGGAVYVAVTVAGCGSSSDDALFTNNGKAGSSGGSNGNGGTFGSAGSSVGGTSTGGVSTGGSGGASAGGSATGGSTAGGTGGSATGGSGGSSGDDSGTTGGTGGSDTDAGTGGNPGTGGSSAAGSGGTGGTGGTGNGPFVRCEQSECNRGAGERCCVRPSQVDTCYDANSGSCICTLCGAADCDGPADCPDGQRCCATLNGILCQASCGAGSAIEVCQDGDGIDCASGGICTTNGYLPPGYLGCAP